MRQVLLYQDEDGGWVAEVPSLPGCVSEGDSREEALKNIAEAAELWLETAADLGKSVPADPLSAEVVALPIAG